MDTMEQMRRWRLILGGESETQFETMNGYGEAGLSKEQLLMDQALAAIYNSSAYGGFGSPGNAGKGGGRGPSNPQITRWLGDVRTLFDREDYTGGRHGAVRLKAASL